MVTGSYSHLSRTLNSCEFKQLMVSMSHPVIHTFLHQNTCEYEQFIIFRISSFVKQGIKERLSLYNGQSLEVWCVVFVPEGIDVAHVHKPSLEGKP
jgi:hypothetical protein